MSQQQNEKKLARHRETLRFASDNGITYSEAVARLHAKEQIKTSGATMAPHFLALATLRAEGITPSSPNFGTRYEGTLSVITQRRASVAREAAPPTGKQSTVRLPDELESALSAAVRIAEGRHTSLQSVWATIAQARIHGKTLPMRLTIALQTAAVARDVVKARALVSLIRSEVALSEPKGAAC